MLFGRVRGRAVCTLKFSGTEGLKLLIVQPLNKKMEPVGGLQVAADVVDAGPGDLCVMVRSRGSPGHAGCQVRAGGPGTGGDRG